MYTSVDIGAGLFLIGLGLAICGFRKKVNAKYVNLLLVSGGILASIGIHVMGLF